LFSSPHNIRVIKSRRMMDRACSTNGSRRDAYSVLVGKPERIGHLENPGVDGRIILKCIFQWWDGGMDWITLAQDRDR
jgi:hypothetical protein